MNKKVLFQQGKVVHSFRLVNKINIRYRILNNLCVGVANKVATHTQKTTINNINPPALKTLSEGDYA